MKACNKPQARASRGWLATLSIGALASLSLSLGCVDQLDAVDYGDPTRLDEVTTLDGITTEVIAPVPDEVSDSPQTELVFRAFIEGENSELRAYGGRPDGPVTDATPEGTPGADQLFRLPVTLLHGTNTFEVVVEEVGGERRRTFTYRITYSGEMPALRIDALRPTDQAGGCDASLPARAMINTDEVCVFGEASIAPDRAIDRIIGSTSAGESAPVGTRSFVIAVPLVADAANTLTVTLRDSRDNETTTTLEVIQDSTPPVLSWVSPSGGTATTSDGVFTLEGEASDDRGVETIEVFDGEALIAAVPVTNPWSAEVTLSVGMNDLRVEAVDIAGNRGELNAAILRQRVSRLRAADGTGSETLLELDEAALRELLSPADQEELLLAEIELEPFLFEAVGAIRDPVSFGIDTDEWSAAEFNFNRLLNLSTDTADLSGTSLEELSELALAIGLPTPRVLAELLDVEVDEPALSTELVVEVLIDNLISTHPNAIFDESGQPVLEITLFDALNDLRPLADRFGPVAATGHPGIIAGSIEAEVFEAGFKLTARATSNLIGYEGYDASRLSKDYLFLLDGDQVLELDIFDDETFSVVGLVDEPVVDVAIAINESPQFFSAGTVQNANPDPERPGFFFGSNQAQNLDPWILERIVFDTVYLRFVETYADQGYTASFSYDAGTIANAAEFTWDRGWLVSQTAGNLGSPPAPQYVWDALIELAQVRLHDGGLAEGDANARFNLTRVPVGVSADELIEALRPQLDEQQEELSELLLGGGAIAPATADFFYVGADDGGNGFLFFRHPSDSDDDYNYINPGFFANSSLTNRLSSTSAQPGTDDEIHHKVRVNSGDVFFIQDDEGDIFRVDVVDANSEEIGIIVTPEEA